MYTVFFHMYVLTSSCVCTNFFIFFIPFNWVLLFIFLCMQTSLSLVFLFIFFTLFKSSAAIYLYLATWTTILKLGTSYFWMTWLSNFFPGDHPSVWWPRWRLLSINVACDHRATLTRWSQFRFAVQKISVNWMLWFIPTVGRLEIDFKFKFTPDKAVIHEKVSKTVAR